MAFLLEDGTGIAGANAYIAIAFADAYFLDRQVSGWDGDTTQKNAAIIKATDWVEKRFGRKFRGDKASSAQGLQWPRDNACDDAGNEWLLVPAPLEQAVAEYALRAIAADLVDDPTLGAGTTGPLTYDRKRVEGAVEVEKRYAETGQQRGINSALVNESGIPEYPAADLLLTELLTSFSGGFIGRA